ncbi:DUF3261 domain-containing protein [Photobacterium aquimaris]|uniref:DUF3261 domain-containing protein n=1 Tax=Photobacterium aquimaris TaxID=512643 RepID=A0A2T3HUG0_9GAMM|nr:DUF3261 domain-containing protein [Photobacterium aquimaris]MCP4956400.1 DUF3261 domain-containing protein [Photobacterium aquimaris]OBU23251.1 hypothetical protein AYY21_13635 [Photobacterium aquimaris]PQJ38188.1 hypothetical protein BTN98_12080 [Photobacterium aquimaris]PSU00709.1 DUF3261 domain-containing protein [Photobacterium aquimaris]
MSRFINNNSKRHFLIALLTTLFISGCATISQPQSNQVEIAPHTLVTLPTPAQLGYSLTASQLITATWQHTNHQLPVQLQVTPQALALAGFSSWGSRILSLDYTHQQLTTYVMPGLGSSLPEPKQVLFNMMITLWPLSAWQQPLQHIGWQLKQTANQRQLIDDKGMVIADINYQNANKLKGTITFVNHQPNYTITIKTLHYQRQ